MRRIGNGHRLSPAARGYIVLRMMRGLKRGRRYEHEGVTLSTDGHNFHLDEDQRVSGFTSAYEAVETFLERALT